MALGGNENMANFTYSERLDGNNQDQQKKQLKQAVSVVCRDIVILEYRKAYNRKGMLWDDDVTL